MARGSFALRVRRADFRLALHDDLQPRGIAAAFLTTRAGPSSTVHLKKTDCFSVSSEDFDC